MENSKKVSLVGTVLFTVCSILVLDSFVAPAIIGVSSITVWIISAIIFFIPYGLLSAELGSTYPDDGGIVSWVGRAFGEFPSVLVGWMYWVNVAFWMPAVFTAFSGWLSLALFPEMSIVLQAIIAVAMCWVIVYIGVKGIELSVLVSNIMAVVKMGILVIFGFMGIAYGVKNGFANDFSIANWVPTMDNTAINAANVDEVDGFVYALQELCSVFGGAQMPVFYILIVLAISTLVANMITWCLGANESFQAAELDKRSKFLAHRSKKYGTSDNLYYLMGVISSALIILNYALSGNANDVFWTLFSFASIVFMLNYLFMFPAAIKLRFTDDAPRQYAVPGGKAGIVVCGVICFLCVALACYFLIDFDVTGYAFWMQLIGVLLTVAVGYWLYRAGKKKN